MQKEIWKDIPSYEGLYQASNLGRIKSLPKKIRQKNNSFKVSKERILKSCIGSSGYLYVVLTKEENKKSFTVHQLVAIAFLNHKPNKFKIVVDHINEIKTDNNLSNLQLLTTRKNVHKSKSSTSKHIGVSLIKGTNKWAAFIYNGNKNINLGSFNTELEASIAYQNKLKEYDKTI